MYGHLWSLFWPLTQLTIAADQSDSFEKGSRLFCHSVVDEVEENVWHFTSDDAQPFSRLLTPYTVSQRGSRCLATKYLSNDSSREFLAMLAALFSSYIYRLLILWWLPLF